jgi:integrase
MTGTRDVADVELEFLNIQRDRNGRPTYYYFRRHGRRWRLPGEPLSEEFMAEYRRRKAETDAAAATPLPDPPEDRRDFPRGTMGRLISDYLATGEFKQLKPRTKAEYERVCNVLSGEHGHKRVAHLKRRHIRQIRDAKADTPGAANTVLRQLKILLNFAVDDELIEASPAAGFKELDVGEWRSWTDDECAKFEKRWAPGTMQRRAYALAHYTGQRKADLVTRNRSHRRDGGIYVVQSKTDEELWIPEHKELTAELGRGVIGIDTLLVTPVQGKPFSSEYFGAWFAEAIEDAGLPDDCVLHGLRKCAARKLADLGLSTEDIKSITGHVTGRMVEKYVKGADQKKRAKRAIKTWERTSRRRR